MSDEEFPEILTSKQVRFEIDFAVGQAGASTIRELTSKNEAKAGLSRLILVDRIMKQFNRLQVRRKAPEPGPVDRTRPPS